MIDDTPRSTTSSGTPRDDRFFSPREYITRNSSTKSSDEYITPRTARNSNSNIDEDQYYSPRIGSGRMDYDHVDSGRGNSFSQLTRERLNANSNDSHQYDNSYNNHSTPNRNQNHTKTDYGEYSPNSPKSIVQRGRERGRSGRSEYKSSDDNEEIYGDEYIKNYDNNSYESNGNSNRSRGGGISEEDLQDIFSFVRHGRSEEIEKLLDRGIPVDVRDERGNTLLIVACQNGNKRIGKNVLRRGANINARNLKGNTPLHYCFHYGFGDTLGQYIIQKGADESARNNMGKPCWDGI
mmetsp:Transcript_36015/g.34084  ORF Transcript_36015/g.34084 Transcript_36015/m.34084 type:complete len:294 (-) Transcript_36015:304-1185(-)|eukprot:CAMPEP_0119037226 /NCGR_PEP_ID=MMETSP1177-20130426/5451_1 /TAXON_ID=2985 /ORGANISM="Ochromonas sp, Strain CCMP1899" /LENGTH=293 /DNA_ID=CAMNT_0006998201 /DNA_START=200 /DNA_END=1081 /DNA_ORIENTATION=+